MLPEWDRGRSPGTCGGGSANGGCSPEAAGGWARPPQGALSQCAPGLADGPPGSTRGVDASVQSGESPAAIAADHGRGPYRPTGAHSGLVADPRRPGNAGPSGRSGADLQPLGGRQPTWCVEGLRAGRSIPGFPYRPRLLASTGQGVHGSCLALRRASRSRWQCSAQSAMRWTSCGTAIGSVRRASGRLPV
mgnify:CR=1 FL=1